MKYVAGYVLLKLGGKKDVTPEQLISFLEATDCQVNKEQAKSVCEALNGKSLAELATRGMDKLGSMAAVSAPAAAPAVPAANKQADKGAKKVEEKKVEEPVEEDADIGGLFD